MQESDACIVHWFGPRLARSFFIDWAYSAPQIKWIAQFYASSVILVWTVLVLPGFIPPEYSLFSITVLIPLGEAFGIKSWCIFKLLVLRWDFLLDFLLTIAVLISLCIVLKWDIRITIVPMLLLMWLDFRTFDSRVLFFWNHKPDKSCLGKFWSMLYYYSLFQFLMSSISFPIVLALGFAYDTDMNDALHFSEASRIYHGNWTESFPGEQPPQGYYANLKYAQFAIDGLLTFQTFQIIRFVLALRYLNKSSQIRLSYLRAPVERNFVTFVADRRRVFQQTNQVQHETTDRPVLQRMVSDGIRRPNAIVSSSNAFD